MIKLLNLLYLTIFLHISLFGNFQEDPYNPTEVKYKLNLALTNSLQEPIKSLDMINDCIAQAERAKDKSMIHAGLTTKGKYYITNSLFEDALLTLNSAYIAAMSQGIEQQIHEAVRLLSEVHITKELRNESLDYLHKGLEISTQLKDSLSICWYLNQIPEIEYETGNMGRAMEFALKGEAFFEQRKDSLSLGKTYLTLSKIHRKLGKSSSAQMNINKSLSLFQSNNQHHRLGETLLEWANLLLFEGKYEDALAKCNEAIAVFKEYDEKDLYQANSILGEINTKMLRFPEGFSILSATLKAQQSIGHLSGQALTHLRIANLHQQQRNYKKATESFNACLRLASTVGLTDIVRQAYKGLSQAKGLSGNIASAYTNLNHYTRITDSLFNIQKIGEASKLEENALLLKHKKELQGKEEELERRRDVITQQKQKQLLLYLVIALFAIIIILAYREFTQKKRANEVLTRQKEEIEKQKQIADLKTRGFTDSLNYAQRIQQAILRTSLKIQKIFPDSFISLYPKDIVSGDFYWIKEKNNRILFALADCTGHGVPGALMSIIGTYGLNRVVNEMDITSPSEVLSQINILFQESIIQKEGAEIFDGMDIALCSYNPKSMELKFAGANIPIYICRSNLLPQPSNAIAAVGKTHTLYSVRPTKQPIGSFFENNTFTNHSIALKQDDVLYLFSDGYSDQFGGPEGRKFKTQQLFKLLLGITNLPLSEQKNILEKSFISWKGNLNQVDDMSFMGIRF